MTLGELKTLVSLEECPEKLVKNSAQRSCERVIASTPPHQEPEIIVYASGYFLYSSDGHKTLGSISNCKEYCYVMEGGKTVLSEAYFDSLDWRVRLTLEGDERIQENQERYLRKSTIPLDEFAYEGLVFADGRDAFDTATAREGICELKEAYFSLLPKQRALLKQIYLYRKSIREISSEEGVSYQAIQNRLQRILDRIVKCLKREL